jgi:hypothetical protein
MDWMLAPLLHRLLEVRDLAPAWAKDRLGDGGLVVLLLVSVAVAAAFLWKIVLDVFEDSVKHWLAQERRLVLVAGYAGVLLLAVLLRTVWVVPILVFLAAGTLLGPAAVRARLRSRAGLAAQVVLVLAVGAAQLSVEYSRLAARHYYVFLAFDRRTPVADDVLLRLSTDYLQTQRAVFRDLPSVHVLPEDPQLLKRLSSHDSEVARVAREVMHLLRRGRFCPALVVATIVDVEHDLDLRIRSVVRGIAARKPDLTATGTVIAVEGPMSDIRVLALRAAFELLRQVRHLRCDGELAEIPGGATGVAAMSLPALEETAVKRRLLQAYRDWLAAGDLAARSLVEDVDRALAAEVVEDETVSRLLRRTTAAVDPARIPAERCANLAKLGLPCPR